MDVCMFFFLLKGTNNERWSGVMVERDEGRAVDSVRDRLALHLPLLLPSFLPSPKRPNLSLKPLLPVFFLSFSLFLQ